MKLRPRKRKIAETNPLPDNTDNTKPKYKRIKLSKEKYVESKKDAKNDTTSAKPDFTLDLSAFSNLPNEILYHHIAVIIPLEWIYVSKYLHKIALQNLERDPRIKWDKQSFERALKVDNVTAIMKHISMIKFEDDYIQRQLMAASFYGCIRVVQYLLGHDSILKLDPSDPPYINDTFMSSLLNAITNEHKDVVAVLIQGGRFKDDVLNKNYYLRNALKNTEIAKLLIENECYVEKGVLNWVIIDYISPKCDVTILKMLLNIINNNTTKDARLGAFNRAITVSAANAVQAMLEGGFLDSIKQFDEWLVGSAIDSKNMATMDILLADKRFIITQASVERAILVNSRKILKRLLDDERVLHSLDFNHLMQFAEKKGTKKMVNVLLEYQNK